MVSLLSLAYLLSFERCIISDKPPGHYDRPIGLGLTVKSHRQANILPLRSSARPPWREFTFVNPRCYLEDDRPSQTNLPALLRIDKTQLNAMLPRGKAPAVPFNRHNNSRMVFHLSYWLLLAQHRAYFHLTYTTNLSTLCRTYS